MSTEENLDSPSLAPGNGAVALVDVRISSFTKTSSPRPFSFLGKLYRSLVRRWERPWGGPRFASADGLVRQMSMLLVLATGPASMQVVPPDTSDFWDLAEARPNVVTTEMRIGGLLRWHGFRTSRPLQHLGMRGETQLNDRKL